MICISNNTVRKQSQEIAFRINWCIRLSRPITYRFQTIFRRPNIMFVKYVCVKITVDLFCIIEIDFSIFEEINYKWCAKFFVLLFHTVFHVLSSKGFLHKPLYTKPTIKPKKCNMKTPVYVCGLLNSFHSFWGWNRHITIYQT